MKQFTDKVLARLEAKQSRMIEIRRYLHQRPELSFQESKTAKYISDFYQGKDCQVQTNVGGIRGVVVDVFGSKESAKKQQHIAIRADFDALPIQEETGLPFASVNPGVMHACGHDAHTAHMLILAETLIELKSEFSGHVRVLHQPAEEVPPGGAKAMIEAGCLDGIDAVLGIHVMSTMEEDTVQYHAGAVQTGRATFKVKIQGKGGHGSMPHLANDAIVAAASFVTSAQTIVSRRISPFETAVVTIGSFDGKGSANVIKDSVTLEGDVRVMSEESRQIVEEEFKQILEGICQAFKVTYELDYLNDYPVLMNDAHVTDTVTKALREQAIPEMEVLECDPQTPSEDFAYYAQQIPACFFYVGAHEAGKAYYPHNHPKFEISEQSLLISAKAKAMATALMACLEEGEE
ncbi:M20 family metallopeptidase [Streptococcus ictaluri]|uniref:Amidohydrolase n=1 Tax=Streptococcus ictaluri 707-05 TaxID=764299 RepID=G5K1P4_9STRE|nr:M20 family metallopeptidase [Streptococcus ictaluri]EHI69981.1 amidohydrolase [Streptococcus ictaluri 707-05]